MEKTKKELLTIKKYILFYENLYRMQKYQQIIRPIIHEIARIKNTDNAIYSAKILINLYNKNNYLEDKLIHLLFNSKRYNYEYVN